MEASGPGPAGAGGAWRPWFPAAPLVVAAIAALSAASTAAAVPEPGDSIWLFASRHLAVRSRQESLRAARYQDGWRRSQPNQFWREVAERPATPTVIYVNGARVTAADTAARGVCLYRSLADRKPEGQALRVVIWSWPSPRTARPVRDFRCAAATIDWHGWRLGRFLRRLPAETRVGLLGFSFGGAIIAGALHNAGGGDLAGRVPDGPAGPDVVRAVLWSPAVDCDALLPGRRYADALRRADRLLVLYNPCDPVLRRYRLVSPCRRSAALGQTGLVSPSRLGSLAPHYEQQNVGPFLGRSHAYLRHYCSPHVLNRTARLLLDYPSPDSPPLAAVPPAGSPSAPF